MTRTAATLLGALLLAGTTAVLATIEDEMAAGEQLDTIILNATNGQGMKPGEVVTRLIDVRPDRAYEAVTAAICLVPNYEEDVCTIGGRHLLYEECAETVESAAMRTGVPPGTVARAVAAGRMCWHNRVPGSDASGRGGNGCRAGFASCS